MRRGAAAVIVVLALAIGSLHLALDAVIFHWRLSPFQTVRGHAVFSPLPILFLLNFIGYVLLAALYALVARASAAYPRFTDVLLLLMTVATLAGWNYFHRPNPRGLGTVAVTLEVVLILVLLVHAATARRTTTSRLGR